MRLTLAALHLLALGIGLGAIWARARALRSRLDTEGLRRVFSADAWWGIAAALWLGTGLPRWLMGTEKAASYYLTNPLFHAKLGIFVLIVVLEIWPMITLIRWRRRRARSGQVDTTAAGRLAAISMLQAALIVAIVFLAVAMARGYGAR
jgi:putative membrane protein